LDEVLSLGPMNPVDEAQVLDRRRITTDLSRSGNRTIQYALLDVEKQPLRYHLQDGFKMNGIGSVTLPRRKSADFPLLARLAGI
jgi:hypothetical protein